MSDEYLYLTEDDEFDCENGSCVDLKVLVNSLRKEIARLGGSVNNLVMTDDTMSAEIARLNEIIYRAEWWGTETIAEDDGRCTCVICGKPEDDGVHQEWCPFYQWEGAQ